MAVHAMTLPPPLPQASKALIFAPRASRVRAPASEAALRWVHRLEAAAGIEPAYKVLQTSACATRLRRQEGPSVPAWTRETTWFVSLTPAVSGTVPFFRLTAEVCDR